MDGNHSSFGKSDEQIVIWSLSSSSDDQWGPVKSYTCAFCKKGFSNAQALGGHMNIHRKDRAKLRQSFDENLLSLDITKSINPTHDHHQPPLLQVSRDKTLFPLDSIEGSCIPKSPYSLSVQDDVSSSIHKGLAISCNTNLCTSHDGDDEDNKLQLSHSLTRTELDLELRLGPEPHEISASSSRSNTREFF